jgi:hypothetical protein
MYYSHLAGLHGCHVGIIDGRKLNEMQKWTFSEIMYIQSFMKICPLVHKLFVGTDMWMAGHTDLMLPHNIRKVG